MTRLAFAVLLVALSTIASAQEDALEPVRQMYASAEYEGALAAIGRLSTDTAVTDKGSVEMGRYRVLCLIALGRADEADRVIETIVTVNPRYQPSDAEVPPRVRAAFSEVRLRVVPGVVRNLYVAAKAAFDRKAFAEAADQLEQAISLVDSLDVRSASEIADLRTLAAGFLELSRAALTKAVVDAVPDVPAASERHAGPAVAASDPVPLQQAMPLWSAALAGAFFATEFRGIVEVDIDETGNVVGTSIIDPIHPLYDPLLVRASSTWKYQPARRDGVPIRAKKRVEVVLRPR